MEERNHLIKEKIRKLNEIREMGVNPYPYAYDVTSSSIKIKEKYKDLKEEEETKDEFSVAGRIMRFRKMGKASFLSLQDELGNIQIYFRRDDIGKENYTLLKRCDMGDFIGVKGHVFKTKTGEVTIYAKEFTILSKGIRPMPEKYHGIQDKELKYRKRYLDLMMDPDARARFKKRGIMLTEIRNWLTKEGFIEVETPILQPIYGGASARPFKTFHNDLKMDMYLRISPELYLKRLIIGGFEKVFDMNKNFRNEGIDKSHNPEFTMIEWYEAYTDFNFQMERFENLVSHLCYTLNGTYEVEYQGTKLNFKPPWKRITMVDAIEEYAGIDVQTMEREELLDYCQKNGFEIRNDMQKGELIATIFEETCEDKLIQPTFVTEHPIEISPLTKKSRKYGDEFVERFEPFCYGMEIGNAYSELNDPIDQLERLKSQEEKRQVDGEAHPMDEDFIESIEYAMPPTGGVGLGVDRVAMLLTDAPTIRDIILFPTLKKD